MLKTITPDKLAELRRRYTKGSRVKLILMRDPGMGNLKEGAMGTVIGVDKLGTIHVAWDCAWRMGWIFVP